MLKAIVSPLCSALIAAVRLPEPVGDPEVTLITAARAKGLNARAPTRINDRRDFMSRCSHFKLTLRLRFYTRYITKSVVMSTILRYFHFFALRGGRSAIRP